MYDSSRLLIGAVEIQRLNLSDDGLGRALLARLLSRPVYGYPLCMQAPGPVQRLVVITLDSCRFDTALVAAPRFLSSVASLQSATAHATFTLPAHVGLFHGYFPLVGDPPVSPAFLAHLPLYSRADNYLQTGRGTVEGTNWLDGLRHNSWRTVGAAGMRWFKSDYLRLGFDEFIYRGPRYSPEMKDLPQWALEDYSLNYPEELVAAVGMSPNWLLFVNSAETHAPYGATGDLLNKQRALADTRNAKKKLSGGQVAQSLMVHLKDQQVRALTTADERIRNMFALLPKPFHFIVTADHGEMFGEDDLWGHVYGHQVVMQVPVWEGCYG